MFFLDVGFDVAYALIYTPEERAAEADRVKAQAEKLDRNSPERAKLLQQYETLAFGKLRNFDWTKFTEITAGMGRAAVSQDTIFDRFKDWVEDSVSLSAKQKAGQVVGDALGRFDNFANPLYDLYNAITGQTEIKDPKATTPGQEHDWPFSIK